MSRPVKFFPAFTKHPANYPPMKESYCATCLVRPRVFEVTLPLDDGLYFIVYFNFLELTQNMIRVNPKVLLS